jgi:tetratricopeptide (TPR) repeat protein
LSPDLRNVFEQVADLPLEEREQYYETNLIAAHIRTDLESLLQFDQPQTGDTLQSMVQDAAADWSTAKTAAVGEYCGPYKLIRLLAQGGMGAVYVGERTDGEVSLRVAIKFVNSAVAGGKEFETRFLRERQILASLNHPGIARLLDAGRSVSRGHPYLVMEFIDGLPIDVHCADLDERARVRLFLDVCDAVSYSHRNLVIHRDLKPSNIMVDGSGNAKLLDFGIAKMLDEAAAASGATRLMTPEYSSPEQLQGLANTTATDIYSLGAVLKKLAGTMKAPPDDLRYIIGMAMRREPADRYVSVDALAEDLRALIDSRPVKARSGDLLYRIRKFLRRYWLPAAALTAAVASLAVGLYIANRERVAAQRRFGQLRNLANTMLRFDNSLRVLPGSTKARQEVVSASIQYLDGLSKEVDISRDADLAMEVANGYLSMAQVQGPLLGSAHLGQMDAAETSLRKAAELVDRVLVSFPARHDALLLGAEVASGRAGLGDSNDNTAHVVQQSGVCFRFVERLIETGDVADENKLKAAAILVRTALANSNMQILDDAARYLKKAIEIGRSVQNNSVAMVQALSTLTQVLRRQGDLYGALASIKEAEAIHQKIKYPDERSHMLATYGLLTRKGTLLGEDESISLGRGAEAVAPLTEARDLAEAWVAKDANDASSRDRVGKVGRLLGDIQRHTDPAKALATYELSIKRIQVVDNVAARRDEARYLAKCAMPLRRLGRPDDARRRLDEAFAILRMTKDYPPPPHDISGETDGAMRALALHELETGNLQRSREIYEELLGWIDERKIGPSTLLLAKDISRLYESVIHMYTVLKMPAKVREYEERRLQVWREWDRKLPGNPFVQREMMISALR